MMFDLLFAAAEQKFCRTARSQGEQSDARRDKGAADEE